MLDESVIETDRACDDDGDHTRGEEQGGAPQTSPLGCKRGAVAWWVPARTHAASPQRIRG